MRIAVPRAELGRYPRQNKVAIGGSVVMLRETGLHPLRGLQFVPGGIGRGWARLGEIRSRARDARARARPTRAATKERPREALLW